MTTKDEREVERRAAIRSLFRDLTTDDFDAYHAEIKAITTLFLEEMAHQFEPIFNAELERRPHEELSEMKTLTSWANHVLRDLHLAVRCPKTGQAATLIADHANLENDRGRFRIEIRDERGRAVKTLTSLQLPVFKLRENTRHQPGSGRFEDLSNAGRGR